jgi:cell division protein FtsW
MSGRTTTTTIGGDKVRLERELAKTRARHPSARDRHRPGAGADFYVLAVVIAVLTLLGIVMVLSASSVLSLQSGGSGWTYFRKQLLWALLGAVALVIGMRVPYQVWRRLVPLGLVVSFGLMVAVLLPGVGRTVNGARSWVELGPVGFQPVEFMKLTLLVYTADLLARRADRMHEVRHTLGPALVVLGAASVLVMFQPDFGAAIVLGAIVLSVAFIAGAPLVPLGGVGAAAALLGVIAVFSTPYRRRRWTAFLDLASTRANEGFQVWQSLVGIASGGVAGLGLGASKAKWGYLPEAHTDFIFAIIAEELGFVGAFGVCALFMAFGVIGARVALRCDDRFGMLVAGGITAWLLVQAFINIGGVTGILPLTGLTLPFVSFGGSSLLVTMAAGGVLLNIARTTR